MKRDNSGQLPTGLTEITNTTRQPIIITKLADFEIHSPLPHHHASIARINHHWKGQDPR